MTQSMLLLAGFAYLFAHALIRVTLLLALLNYLLRRVVGVRVTPLQGESGSGNQFHLYRFFVVHEM